jgi:hypothetical protein
VLVGVGATERAVSLPGGARASRPCELARISGCGRREASCLELIECVLGGLVSV